MTLPPGHLIGNYEILGPAGSGGMGEVYRARDQRLNRIVAIKALPAGVAENQERLTRFENEARLLASLNHPNIAGIYGIEDATGDDSRGPYLVLEFVEGETLDQRLLRGPLPVTEAAQLCTQIASGIEAAHEKGIIHRDLKPANIMINTSGMTKVLDFGLAKDDAAPGAAPGSAIADSPTIAMPATAEGMVLGTAPYMSPEQARGKPLDKRVDVWAFGCILMECLTGRPTFAGDTPSDVMAKILEREPDWDQIPGSVPPQLADLLRRCLTKDVNQRPRDIGDLGREIHRLVIDSRTSQPVPAASDAPSLAVLYFENLAQDPESEYFCSGITEDILTDLSKIKGLRVASKNAVSRYRGAETDLSRIALDLGVTAVLEGSVRRAGDKIRITTQLINTSDGFQLWGERFDRTLDDVFAVQDEIASAIVSALRVSMSPSDAIDIRKDRPDNANAYDLYLKGREKYRMYQKEAMEEAMELFQEAIRLDPDYALAWAGMADCHGQMLQYRWTQDTEETVRLGLEAAHKASAIDPKLPDAYKAEAVLLSETKGWGDEVLKALERAIEADPRYAPALINLGVFHYIHSNLAHAERLIRRVLEIDPREPFSLVWLVAILFTTERLQEALTLARRIQEISDTEFYLRGAILAEVACLLRMGQKEEAESVFRAAEADRRLPAADVKALQAYFAFSAGRLEEARALLRETTGRSWYFYFSQSFLGQVAIGLGETDLAASELKKHLERPYVRINLRLRPELHPLLQHEAFRDLEVSPTLVWPLQAPMIDEARFAMFKEVRIESGRPEGSGIFGEPLE